MLMYTSITTGCVMQPPSLGHLTPLCRLEQSSFRLFCKAGLKKKNLDGVASLVTDPQSLTSLLNPSFALLYIDIYIFSFCLLDIVCSLVLGRYSKKLNLTDPNLNKQEKCLPHCPTHNCNCSLAYKYTSLWVPN